MVIWEVFFIEAVFIKSDFEFNKNTAVRFGTEEYMTCLEFEFHFKNKEETKRGKVVN